MSSQTLRSLVKHAIKSLESDKAKKKGLVATCCQALGLFEGLESRNWEENPTEDEVSEDQGQDDIEALGNEESGCRPSTAHGHQILEPCIEANTDKGKVKPPAPDRS